ncbi:MAG: hypothetical protein ACTSVU_07095 [Promethearchaeota archaeon]
MSDNAVSSGITSTAAIITTVLIITATFVVAGSIAVSINQNGQNLADQINTKIDVIAMGDIHSGNTTISAFVKNSGEISINSYGSLDVILDGDYFIYGSSLASQYRWNATLLNDNGNERWDPTETIKIQMSFPTGFSLSAGSHKLVISLSGSTETYLFSVD